ncbi:MAG: glutaredoxin family protein [Burkholderiales bacterium]|nr:glutaredoxin family protein [Burkholderiales bacterium]
MLSALDALAPRLGFDVEVIDVDRDPALEARYGQWVPVLVHGDAEICHYHLDQTRLTAYLAAFR